jgi:hypothetical protein
MPGQNGIFCSLLIQDEFLTSTPVVIQNHNHNYHHRITKSPLMDGNSVPKKVPDIFQFGVGHEHILVMNLDTESEMK